LPWSLEYIIPQAHPVFYIETSVTLFLIVFGLLFSSLIGGLAGYLPARRAANLKLAEALRYE
jgi:ABC-type antimicrobial peptide transport system permease subunit